MAEKSLQIECPKCGESISVDEVLRSDLEGEFEKRYQKKLKKAQDDLAAQEEVLARDKAQLERQKEAQAQTVEKKVAEARAELEKKARERARQDLGVEMEAVKAELAEKAQKLADAQKAELDLRKKANALEERERNLDLEAQRKLDEERAKIREQASQQAAEENSLKNAEKDRKLEDMSRQLEEMRRRMEQGSQQSQGETLELVLESVLKQQFPQDILEPVPKGLRGADVVQTVLSTSGQAAGKIVWEAKRTKAWGGDWVDKLKDDQREVKADVAILVSQVLPKEVQGFGLVDGVWVSDLKSYLPLALMVRIQLLHLQQVRGSLVNRGEKMEILYTYLTGTQFRQRVEAIVEGFSTMKDDLEHEKRAIQKQWAAREKQIEKVLANTAGMVGDLQGLVGANMLRIEPLEMEKLEAGKEER
jgi:hypothetical protein